MRARPYFAVRQIVGSCRRLVGPGAARLGIRQALRAAPALFVAALATAAVFLPGIGVGAGASRWLRLGLSGNRRCS